VHDGRVITEVLTGRALPPALAAHAGTIRRLGAVYKQLTAPFGAVGEATITASTTALRGDDATYQRLEAALERLTGRRDPLAASIRQVLEAAAFDGRRVDERQARRLILRSLALIERFRRLADPS
jgi:hypothetical protein